MFIMRSIMTPPEVARDWFETVWNRRDIAAALEVVGPDVMAVSEGGVIRSAAQFREQVYLPMIQALPDLRVEILGTVGEGEEVVVRWVARGTHAGEGMGLPASGRKVEFSGMTWFRICDGLIVEAWDRYNLGGLLHFLKTGTESQTVRLL